MSPKGGWCGVRSWARRRSWARCGTESPGGEECRTSAPPVTPAWSAHSFSVHSQPGNQLTAPSAALFTLCGWNIARQAPADLVSVCRSVAGIFGASRALIRLKTTGRTAEIFKPTRSARTSTTHECVLACFAQRESHPA